MIYLYVYLSGIFIMMAFLVAFSVVKKDLDQDVIITNSVFWPVTVMALIFSVILGMSNPE